MEIIERFRAAPNERKIWSVCYALSGLAILAVGVWMWDILWTVPVAVIGLVVIAGSVGHELYRRPWGTWGLIAGLILLAAAVAIFLSTGLLSWRPTHLVGPALCLIGAAAFIWRKRPTNRQRYIVPKQASWYIARMERDLRQITPETPFHAALDRGFEDQVDAAAAWLAEAYDDGAGNFSVTALYIEMNRFDINTDRWFLDAFVFKMSPAEMFEDLTDSLGDYEHAYEEEFVLTGMEDLQQVFEQADEDDLPFSDAPDDARLAEAMGITFDLITARMMELIAAAHQQASRRGHPVGRIRVFANSHDSMWFPLCSPGGNRSGPVIARDA